MAEDIHPPHADDAPQQMILFNFGYIKHQAKPGSWRRGYAYYREKQIQNIKLTQHGVNAKVKGKFKEAYTIKLHFTPEGVKPNCDCPLEEDWCKHAVATALEAVNQQMWEAYFGLPEEDETVHIDPRDYLGNYRFVLGNLQQAGMSTKSKKSKNKEKFFRIKIVERRSKKALRDLEAVLKTAVKNQAQGKEAGEKDGYNNTQKREFNVMQLVLKQGKSRSQDGWFNIPVAETDAMMQLLAQAEEVTDDHGKRIIFEQNPLFLLMGVNVSMAGNVLVSLHWVKESPYDIFPLQEITMFGRNISWGYYNHHMYPLSNQMSELPADLTKSSFTDIKDADGGKFMYEVLPKLRETVDMDLADIVHQLKLQDHTPEKHLKVELTDEATLKIRVALEFVYDGTKVPYSKKVPESPYLMVVKKETETIYWIKRDPKAEQDAYQFLLDARMDPMQTNLLMAEGDDAIDFYNAILPEIQSREVDPWHIKISGDLSSLKASDDPLKVKARIDFANTVDQFTLSIDCAIGNRQMSLDDVRNHLMQGKKYFFLKNHGYIEIPLTIILQFTKTLQAFDAEEVGVDQYKIMTFKAGLIAELVEMGVELDLSKKFQKFWDVISATSSMEEMEVPKNVNAELRPYQKQGFNWLWFLYSYGLNGILADDMGLGKTLQALVVLQHAKNEDGQQPSLIVCPSTIVFNWVNEAARFTPELKVVNLTGPTRHAEYKKIKDADIVITNYALLRRDIRALKEYNFRYVILDESQYIKNYESQTSQAAKRIQAGHRLALSGTPIENRLSELWSVFDYLMPGFMYDIDEFKYRYVSPIEERGNRDAERRLKKQVFPFILRRLKQDVAKDLPPKIESIKYCQLTEKQQELYLDILEKTKEEVFSNVGPDGKPSNQSIFSALLRLRQICCHPKLMGDEMSGGLKESGKLEALQDMIEEVISEGHRILLYSQFVEMLKIIRSWLEVKGIKYEYLTGETKDRENAVYRFNNDESIPIFLISLKAGGTGLNLTGADYVIHYDPWWNPAAEDQATDRAHRIGQNKTVFVYRLITKGTVEEKIMKLKDRKRDLVDSIIAADRSVGKMLSFEDLKEILSPDF